MKTKKNRSERKRIGVLVSLEDCIDVQIVLSNSALTEKRLAIEYMRKGYPPIAMLHYQKSKDIGKAYRSINYAFCHSFSKWRRVDWF